MSCGNVTAKTNVAQEQKPIMAFAGDKVDFLTNAGATKL